MQVKYSDESWMFTRSCNYAEGKSFLLSFFDDGTDVPKDVTQVLFIKPGGLSHFMTAWQAVAICAVFVPAITGLVISGDGRVLEGSKGFSETVIDDSIEGPAYRGVLRDVRQIGDHAYACGMKRQVYRRETDGKWTRFDKGVVLPLTSGEIAGFNSIDGFSEDDIYAVGWGGEIWHCAKGAWEKIESPTNIKLERVVCAGDGQVYAVGQCGIILRGRGHGWDIVEQAETKEQFWGTAWHLDRLWLATASAVYVLDPEDDLKKIEIIPDGEKITCGWLDAGFGVMWSVGAKHLFRTTDGIKWEQVFTDKK